LAVSRLFASSIQGGRATLLKGRIGQLSSHSWPPTNENGPIWALVLAMNMNTHSAVPVPSEKKAHSIGVAAPSGASISSKTQNFIVKVSNRNRFFSFCVRLVVDQKLEKKGRASSLDPF